MASSHRYKRWYPWALGISILFNLAFLAGFFVLPRLRASTQSLSGAGSTSSKAGWNRLDEELPRGLGLTASQAQQLQLSRDALRDDIKAQRQGLVTLKEMLVKQLQIEPASWSAIWEITGRFAEVQRTTQERIVAHLIQVREKLTPTQKEKFDELVEGQMCTNPMCPGTCLGSCSKSADVGSSSHREREGNNQRGCKASVSGIDAGELNEEYKGNGSCGTGVD